MILHTLPTPNLNTVYSSHDKSSVLPLLYPRGNLSRDTVPEALLKDGLRVNSVLCYNTTSDSEIDQHLQHLSGQEVSNSSILLTDNQMDVCSQIYTVSYLVLSHCPAGSCHISISLCCDTSLFTGSYKKLLDCVLQSFWCAVCPAIASNIL